MSNKKSDRWELFTQVSFKILDILFIKNTKCTCLGFLTGNTLYFFSPIISPWIPGYESVPVVGFIMFGILLFNIPSLGRKYDMDPLFERRFFGMKRLHRYGNISAEEKKRDCRKLLDETLNISSVNEAVFDEVEIVNVVGDIADLA